MKCFSIGYQGRTLSEFCHILARNSVKVLIDVRARAWSYRPEFRKKALQAALQKYGIRYRHCKLAGNPFRPKKGDPINLELCTQRYLQYLNGVPEVIETLEKEAMKQYTAVFCYETERTQCHRGVLIALLEDRNSKMECVDL